MKADFQFYVACEAKPGILNNQKRLIISFPYHAEQIKELKRIGGIWDPSLRAWLINDTPEHRSIFFSEKKHLFDLENFRSWLQANRYSENTIKSYTDGMNVLANYYSELKPEELTNKHLIEFFRDYAYKKNLSVSWQRLIINALKLYFQRIENRTLNLDEVVRPKKDKLLPNVLDKQEIEKMLRLTVNIKHRSMLALIYACGLRRSELLNLLPAHVNSDRGILEIKKAKGRKDRIAPIPPSMIEMLRAYFLQYRPTKWLFEGQNPGEQYSGRSLAQVLDQAVARAKINKPVTLHWLRHSYATHLLESGVYIRYIQELLGHKSSKTTEIYTHVSKKALGSIQSPFNDLKL